MNPTTFQLNKTIQLESGAQLVNPKIAYHTYGTLNKDKSNVVWIAHALTANSDVFDWWKGLFAPNEIFNDKEHFIVCANVLGSHYGTTNPLSINPETGDSYFHTFPKYTIRDIVQLHIELANHLEIENIHLLMGGSMGGQQALEWAILQPDRIEQLVLIATNAIHSPWGVAFNESQRLAIENDPTWKLDDENAGIDGMKVARSLALLSYRNYRAYEKTQQPTNEELIYPDRAASYQKYQGEKLAKRFNAFSYWHLSKAMDSQNVGRGRGGVEVALQNITARTLVLTMQDDVLFPKNEQLRIANGIPNAIHQTIPTEYGHDGFLIETLEISRTLSLFLEKNQSTIKKNRFNNLIASMSRIDNEAIKYL